MKRIAAVAITAAVVLGSSGTAEAKSSKPKTSGVALCITALKWAQSKPTADRDDLAALVCAETVKTKKQAAKVYKWAKQPGNQHALDIIG